MLLFNKNILNKITLTNLKRKMDEADFDSKFIEEVLCNFEKRIAENGETQFQKWVYRLNYSVPEEFENNETCIKVYQMSKQWIEREVSKLEKETKLTWEEQAADINNPDERVRKTQLVIRHRLTEIVLDLRD